MVDAWSALQEPGLVDGSVLVLDWGGGWTGLDAAEVLGRAGHHVTLAIAGAMLGEAVHQYQRNRYLGRLDELNVAVVIGTEVAEVGGEVVLRNVFSGRVRPLGEWGTIVLEQGRVPDDALWLALADDARAVRVGDVLGPRGLEEAIAEGFALAKRTRTQHHPRTSINAPC